jgi:dihydroxyacetone kinase-like protein
MQEATSVVDRGAGVLHIVKNYTGDVMNFEMAGEMAAADSGVRVETVVTDDDVAVQDSTWTAGRRGVGVTVLLEKIVGAAAEEGRDLDAIVELAKRVNGQGRSMGMALTSCTVPSAGKPTFDLPEDEMEMGVGIHGEPGRRRVPLAGAAEIAEMLVEPVLADLDFTGGPGIVMLNGMGGSPLIELYLMYGEVATLLEKAGVQVARTLVGNYITSLDMAGAVRDRAQGRRRAHPPVGCSRGDRRPAMGSLSVVEAVTVDRLVAWLSAFRDAVHEHGAYLTELDSAIGDADHGANLIRGWMR